MCIFCSVHCTALIRVKILKYVKLAATNESSIAEHHATPKVVRFQNHLTKSTIYTDKSHIVKKLQKYSSKHDDHYLIFNAFFSVYCKSVSQLLYKIRFHGYIGRTFVQKRKIGLFKSLKTEQKTYACIPTENLPFCYSGLIIGPK